MRRSCASGAGLPLYLLFFARRGTTQIFEKKAKGRPHPMLTLDHVRLPLAHFELDVTFATRAQSTGIFGPSGSGKTTILELIAGIRQPQSGTIAIDEVIVNNVPARKRAVGYVPQGESLFPHMTVERNIRFGVRDHEAETFIQRVVQVLEIAPLMRRGVGALSAGESKRVALALA